MIDDAQTITLIIGIIVILILILAFVLWMWFSSSDGRSGSDIDGLEYSRHVRSPIFWFGYIIFAIVMLSWGVILFSQIYAHLLGLIFNLPIFQSSSGYYGIITESGAIVVGWECTFTWFMVLFTSLALIKHGWRYVIIGNIAVFGLNLLRMVLTVYLGVNSFEIIQLADYFLGLMYIIIMGLIFAMMIIHVVLR